LEFRHQQSIPLGVVIKRVPGVTRWAKWVWKPVSVLPGAAPANWKILRREGETVEYHAATVPLDLFQAASIPITRHVKIRADATPYDPAFTDYFEQRARSRRTSPLTWAGMVADV